MGMGGVRVGDETRIVGLTGHMWGWGWGIGPHLTCMQTRAGANARAGAGARVACTRSLHKN